MPAADPTLEARLLAVEQRLALLERAVADLQAAGPALLREISQHLAGLAGPEGEPAPGTGGNE